jgi:hypothetical protein
MRAGKLLQRYSPLLVLGIIELVVVLLAPSTPPVTTLGSADGTGTSVTAPGGTTGASSLGTAAAGGSAAGGGAGAAGSTGTTGLAAGVSAGSQVPVRVGNTVVGSSSAGGKVTSCPGTQPAPWAYMPPCLTFSGTNGGASMPGVTGTDINFVWLQGVVPPALAAIGSQAGLSYTPDQLCESLGAYTKVLNKRWTLYGRHFVPLDGPGSHSGKAQGNNCHFPYFQSDNCGTTDYACFRAQADVIASMKPKPAIVFGNVQSPPPLLDELAKKHILVMGQGTSDAFTQPLGPYVWDWQMATENDASFGAEYFCQKLVGKPVAYAGPEVMGSGNNPLQPPMRKIAIVHDAPVPDTFTPGAKTFVKTVSQCGNTQVAEFSFSADVNTLAQDMQTIAAKIKLGGYTTVYLYADMIAVIDLSNALDSEAWHPELVICGLGAMDDDLLAQLANPNSYRYAFGLSLRRFQQAPSTWDYYKAYRDSGATNEPMSLALNVWPSFWMAGDMFQTAGPAPSLVSIRTGMFNMPLLAGNPETGPMKWGVAGDSYLGQRAVREVWYCPTRMSPKNGKAGTYVGVLDDRRFQHGQIDRTNRIFPNGVCAA